MRFTKIPLIATLMAVALSLLIVLPALAQVSGDRTDGRDSTGNWLDVRVAANLNDVQGRMSDADDYTDPDRTPTRWTVVPRCTSNGPFDAKDTYFNRNLYVSNDKKAYNTILITAAVADDERGNPKEPSR